MAQGIETRWAGEQARLALDFVFNISIVFMLLFYQRYDGENIVFLHTISFFLPFLIFICIISNLASLVVEDRWL